MTEPLDPIAPRPPDPIKRGGGLVATALVLALFSFMGPGAMVTLLLALLAWKLVSGSRAASAVIGLATLAWGFLLIADIVKGSPDDQFVTDRILTWARCLAGFAAPALLWLHRDVRRYLRAARESGGVVV